MDIHTDKDNAWNTRTHEDKRGHQISIQRQIKIDRRRKDTRRHIHKHTQKHMRGAETNKHTEVSTNR